MKNFQQNLMVLLSLCLCGLSAFQWVRESRLQQKFKTLAGEVPVKAAAIQTIEGQLKRAKTEIERLDKLKTELTATINSNRAEILRLTAELERSQKQVEADKTAIIRANESIQTQNNTTTKQNELMKKLAAERNEAVEKFNKLAADYNELAKKWNELQEQHKTK